VDSTAGVGERDGAFVGASAGPAREARDGRG